MFGKKQRVEMYSLLVGFILTILSYIFGAYQLGNLALSYLILLIHIVLIVPKLHLVIANPRFARYLRYLVMMLPYILALLFIKVKLLWRWDHLGALYGVGFGLLLLAVYIRKQGNVNVLFTKECALAKMELKRDDLILFTFKVTGSAIFQEIYYRGVLLLVLSQIFNPELGVILTAGLFTYEHFFNAGSRQHYRLANYLTHFILSLVNGFLVLYTQSLWPAILTHLVFNSLRVAEYFYRFFIWKKKDIVESVQEYEL